MKKPLEEVAASAKLSRTDLELRLADMRHRLFELREKRPRPQRDSKIVTSWNGAQFVHIILCSYSFVLLGACGYLFNFGYWQTRSDYCGFFVPHQG